MATFGSVLSLVIRQLIAAASAIARHQAIAPMAGPIGSYEALILRTLCENEGISLEAVVERVADEVLRAEQMAGAWTTDIAIWGPPLYHRETMQAIHRMLGRSIVLEAEGDGPWLAVPVGTH